MLITSCGLGPDNGQRFVINLGQSRLLPELLSVRDTEAVLRLSHASIYALIKSGKLDALKVGSATRITRRSIEQLINSSPRVRDKLLAANEAAAAELVRSPETECDVSLEHIEPALSTDPRDRAAARSLADATPDRRDHHRALERPSALRRRDSRPARRGNTGNSNPSG